MSRRDWVTVFAVAAFLAVLVLYGRERSRANAAAAQATEVKQNQMAELDERAARLQEQSSPAPGQAQVPAGDVEPESQIITPQGLLLEDGSFLWQDLGSVGHWLNADGDLWCRGERPNDGVTDFVVFPGGSISLRMWQGTLYQYRGDLGFEDVLDIVVPRNVPDKFRTTLVHLARVWKVENGVLRHLMSIDRATGAPVSGATAVCNGGLVLGDVRFDAAQPGAAAPSTAAGFPATASQAASTFGVSGKRSVQAGQWEGCPGETQCWHLKDAEPSPVNVPSGVKYEGWDGKQDIQGLGPATVSAAGITLRPQ